MTADLLYFTAKKIVMKKNKDGILKKKVDGMPPGWQNLTEENITDHIHIDKGDKVICVRTGKLNNITVFDFDSKEAYDNAVDMCNIITTFHTIKTPNGYHVYGKYVPGLKSYINTEHEIDIRSDGNVVFGNGTIREDGQKYEKYIDGSINREFPKELIDYIIEINEKPKSVSKKTKKNTTESIPKVKEEKNTRNKSELILDTILTKYIKEYDSWLKIIWAMRSDPDVSEEYAIKISKKAENYDEDFFIKTYRNYKYGKEITKKTYYYYAKLSDPIKFYDICQSFDNHEFGNIDVAETFIELSGDSIVCISSKTSKEDDKIFIYDEHMERWREDKNGDLICNMVEGVLLPYYKNLKKIIEKEYMECNIQDEEKKLEIGKKYGAVKDVLKIIQVLTNGKDLYKIIRRKVKTHTHDIRFNMLESQTNNLHFKNGVLDVMTGIFRKKNKYDYMTLSLSWDYIEDKNDIDPTIIDEVNSMFHKMELNEDVNKFIKSWLFYCLTGSTEEQIFLFQLGESAANGKSTLFSIMSKCFEFYTFKLDSKVFDLNYAQAHKQFAILIDKPVRFAYIEELGSKQIDGQLLKDTVDGEMNVNIMFSTADVCKSQAKINIAGNGILTIKLDKGVSRRMKVKECLSQFLPDQEFDDYENKKFIRDEKIMRKFEDDKFKNALLHILLEHKKITIPKEVNKFTDEIQNDCDPFKMDFDEFFIVTDIETDRTSVSEIEEYLKNYNAKAIKSNMRRIGNYKINVNKTHNQKKGCYEYIRLRTEEE